jgi:TolB-like protein
MSLLAELKRRNVFRVALFYIVAAWVVIQVAETVLPMFEVPDGLLRGLVILLALGFVPAVIFAWVFEWTPEGIRRETEVEVPNAVKLQTAYKLNWATLIAAVLAIGLLVADRLLPEAASTATAAPAFSNAADTEAATTATGPDPASIAVLPFIDLSPQGDQAYFSEGIAEEILNVLARIDGLRVASRTSAFVFKSETKSIPVIAETLGVAYVLEGSVRKAGDRVRITAQLIGARSDAHLWSDTWDRELTAENLFAIQDEIANAIVAALGETMGLARDTAVHVTATTANLDAYDLYLQARQSLSVLSPESARLRVELLQRAVELDPRFADAWGELAISIASLPTWDHALAVAPFQHRALEAAEQALALDPEHRVAWETTLMAYSFLNRWEDFATALTAARNRIPGFDGVPDSWLELGYLDRARMAAIQQQIDDPTLRQFWVLIEGLALEAMGKPEQALEKLESAVLYGYQGEAEDNMADIYRRLGETPAANAILSLRMARDEPELIPLLPFLHDLLSGDLSPGSASARRFVALARELGFDAEDLAQPGSGYGLRVPREVAVALGHADAVARTYFSDPDSNEPGGNSPRFWMWTPKLHHFRQSEAFRQRVRDSGMLDYWREHGWPDLCRPLVTVSGEDDFECE